ncbi:MAG: RagB/SusD family nutrient uptake outer membrane protein [Bacteroidota bacterium]
MKFNRKIIIVLSLIGMVGCNADYLQLEPTDKVSADALFSSPEGVKTFMAGLYYQMPIEDFNSTPDNGISWNTADANINGHFPIIITDDACGSQRDDICHGPWSFYWWNEGYKLNRDVNLLFSVIPELKVSEEEKDALLGEAAFMRAYIYYALAKRYGGVPIITEIADLDDQEAMNVPRSTEKETWDFVLENCDIAASLLGDGDGNRRRGTKWAAYALKSRAALHAASVAKYWDRAPLSGAAKDAGLVGMDPSVAAEYYLACINASDSIIKSGRFSLYKASPAGPEEAAENYREMFEDPNRSLDEVIFLKGFTLEGVDLGSNQDNWGNPAQTAGAWPHPGRFNPTIEFVDAYEDYSNPGQSAPVVTTVDGNVYNYDGYDASRSYLEFDHPGDIFASKDARLHATTILPSSIWKGVEIIIQGGYIQPDGTPKIEQKAEIEVDSTIYYTYGGSNTKLYSGFDPTGGNYTRTGFLFRKFLDSQYVPKLGWNYSLTDWIDFRYAEVLLNYAEAVVESGAGDAALAEEVINDIRHRAAHTTDIPLSLENVLRERRVELAFENKRYWDLIRRREYHTAFFQTNRHSLVPILDLRTMKYIFVRKVILNTNPHTFLEAWYYKAIPGIGSNGLIQNPQY